MYFYRQGIIFSAICFLFACNSSNDPGDPPSYIPTPGSEILLKPVNDCGELKQLLANNLTESLVAGYRFYSPDGDFIFASEAGASSDSAVVTNASPDTVSQTNIQEAGVDEADSVKADSNGNLFVAHHQLLLINRGFPPDNLVVLSRLDLKGRISGLYLLESSHRLIALVTDLNGPVFAQSEDSLASSPAMYFDWEPSMRIVTIDVSDLFNPVITSDIKLDGELVTSRLIADRLHVLSRYELFAQFDQFLDDQIYKWLEQYRDYYFDNKVGDYIAVRDKIRLKIHNRLSQLDLDDWLPTAQQMLDSSNDAIASTCDAIHAPRVSLTRNSLMTVTSLDSDGGQLSQVSVLGNGWITYVSATDLFLVQNSFGWWWTAFQQQQSAIHHFSLSDQDPTYQSSKLVDGGINNRFSLSYYDEHLRVATSEPFQVFADGSSGESVNHLFVLKDNGLGGMNVVGQVNNFALGERIFSARFFSNKAYIVTFRFIDPLFAFDLSDRQSPQIAGELKIPGFSNYIHPVSEDLLLTIGRDGDGAGLNGDIAVKLIDVTDPTNMQVLDSFVPDAEAGYGWSDAGWDPHAFNYDPHSGLLAIPFSSFSGISGQGFSGLLAMNIDLQTSTIAELGRLDHRNLARDYCEINSLEFCEADFGYGYWLSQPRRSIVMTATDDVFLFSISTIGMNVVNTDNFSAPLGSLIFPQTENKGYYWY
jgi:uncharacterized secreted protein with C-terminal beta-propeller domain